VLDPAVTRRVLNSVQRPNPEGGESRRLEAVKTLTVQESRVLELAAVGKSNKQIAQDLHLSEGTVRNYLSTVFGKLGVESRVQAALLWERQSKS